MYFAKIGACIIIKIIANTPSTILDQVGASSNRSFRVQAHFVPLRWPCDSPEQNPSENTVVVVIIIIIIHYYYYYYHYLFIYLFIYLLKQWLVKK